MALLMDFTDDSGIIHAPAHWRAVQINISAADRTINLVFYAYKDVQAFLAGRQPLPGGVKTYSITGIEFLTVASAAPAGETMYDALAHAAEAYALARKDTGTGELDEAGEPVLDSFFASATVI